ncbi:MAG: class I SAM-dependent methyltransferase [Methylobacterium mesophilicum]|nr:class I SAM-dependent methyltransferase [Methylobacterium mesophilicum]
MSAGPSDALDGVYAARTPDELNAAYRRWAETYDSETIALGYCLPFVVAAWVARHVPREAGAVLDVGCGTGLSGPVLRALGYSHLEGLDFSSEMLRLAEARNTYRRLTCATLGETLPFADGAFAALFSTGVFTEGHAPASSLFELARILMPGGKAVLTVRTSVLESGGFAEAFARLETAGIWRQAEASAAFRAFVLAEPDVLVRCFVFEKA